MVYLDSAATSFPKAPGVTEAVCEHVATVAGSAGRGHGRFPGGGARQRGPRGTHLRRRRR